MKIENLVISNYEWLCAKARKLCYDEYDAEDLVADTVLRILESGSRFDTQREFRPWAQTIMYNLRFTQLSRKKRIEFLPLLDYDAPMVLTPEEEMQASIVRGVIEELAKDFNSVRCVQLFVDGYTVSEIAEMMDALPATIRSRLFAGRKRIREALTLIGINVSKC